VLCVDEKSQLHALDRSQPIVPVLPDCPARAAHDYLLHGKSSLFAALDAAFVEGALATVPGANSPSEAPPVASAPQKPGPAAAD